MCFTLDWTETIAVGGMQQKRHTNLPNAFRNVYELMLSNSICVPKVLARYLWQHKTVFRLPARLLATMERAIDLMCGIWFSMQLHSCCSSLTFHEEISAFSLHSTSFYLVHRVCLCIYALTKWVLTNCNSHELIDSSSWRKCKINLISNQFILELFLLKTDTKFILLPILKLIQ